MTPLEKPIILDETGIEIKTELANIKTAQQDMSSKLTVLDSSVKGGFTNLIDTLNKLFGTDPVSQMDGSKKKYMQVMQEWFASKAGSPATLTALVTEWYTITRKSWHGWVDFPTTGVTAGTKGGDNAGLACTPSTNETANQDDYAGHPLFAWVDCNWIMDATTLEPVITAICGVTDGFERNNPDKLVGVLQMSGYLYTKDVNANTYRIGYSSYYLYDEKPSPLPEAVKVDGSVRPWVLHTKYDNHTMNGKLTSYSGVIPTAYSISHNTLHTLSTATGTGYSGMCWCDWSFLQLMFHIKYANLSADGILQGCLVNNYNGSAAVSETGVKRILLTASEAANFEVGMGVLIGTDTDRSKAAAYSISTNAGCIITAIEDVTVSGTAYKAIYVDTASTFDTTAGTTKIVTFHWPTGTCDNVRGSDGSPKNPGSGKYPALLQGIEYSNGGWEVLADTIANYTQESGVYYMQPFFAERTAHQSTSITANYKAGGVKVVQPGSSSYQYIKHKKIGRGGALMPDVYGGSSSTYFKDAIYILASTAEVKEVVCFGRLSSGTASFGLSCAYCNLALTSAYWNIVSRPSPNGNRGEFAA